MTAPTTDVGSILKRQYHAALAMLDEAIRSCPEAEWTSTEHRNASWQLACHVLFFTHLYLQPNEAAFQPWSGLHGSAVDPDPSTRSEPHPKELVLEYCRFCDDLVDSAIDRLDLESPESGFYWYPVSKLEHQLINIRHVQHHTAQLADRVRSAADVGIRWVGTPPASVC